MEDEVLIVSDLHLSSRAVDEFMWDLFPQIEAILISEKIDKVFVLGDLHEAKSGFSAEFVNRMVDGFVKWTNHAAVTILSGNHDGITSAKPFMAFLNHLPRIDFITQPKQTHIPLVSTNVKNIRATTWLPHSRNPLEDWKNIDLRGQLVFAHVTVNQAVSELNRQLSGHIEDAFFKDSALTLGGDVHTPGKVGYMTYIGSPYATKMFADNTHKYRGIVLNLRTLKQRDVYFNFPRRLTIEVKSIDDFTRQIKSVQSNSQVKIRLQITTDNMGEWKKIKQEVRQQAGLRNIQIVGLDIVKECNKTNETIVSSQKGEYITYIGYCESNKIDSELRELGNKIIQEASSK